MATIKFEKVKSEEVSTSPVHTFVQQDLTQRFQTPRYGDIPASAWVARPVVRGGASQTQISQSAKVSSSPIHEFLRQDLTEQFQMSRYADAPAHVASPVPHGHAKRAQMSQRAHDDKKPLGADDRVEAQKQRKLLERRQRKDKAQLMALRQAQVAVTEDTQFAARRKAELAAAKARASEFVAQEKLEDEARAAEKARAALLAAEEEAKDAMLGDFDQQFALTRQAEIARARERRMAFAKQEAQRLVGIDAASGSQTARSILSRVAEHKLRKPSPARETKAVPVKTRSAPRPRKKTSFELLREEKKRREEAARESSRRGACKERDVLLKDQSTAQEMLDNLSRCLDNMRHRDPKRRELAEHCDELRDNLNEIATKLSTALRCVEYYGGDSEEQRAKAKAEKEARAADYRRNNALAAASAAVNRTPYSAVTNVKILSAVNPWPNRPN